MCSPSQGYYQGQHSKLSEKTQAVVDAFRLNWSDEPLNQDLKCLASAIRAATKETSYIIANDDVFINENELLDIVFELENLND
jgi:hypothetical protein